MLNFTSLHYIFFSFCFIARPFIRNQAGLVAFGAIFTKGIKRINASGKIYLLGVQTHTVFVMVGVAENYWVSIIYGTLEAISFFYHLLALVVDEN